MEEVTFCGNMIRDIMRWVTSLSITFEKCYFSSSVRIIYVLISDIRSEEGGKKCAFSDTIAIAPTDNRATEIFGQNDAEVSHPIFIFISLWFLGEHWTDSIQFIVSSYYQAPTTYAVCQCLPEFILIEF